MIRPIKVFSATTRNNCAKLLQVPQPTDEDHGADFWNEGFGARLKSRMQLYIDSYKHELSTCSSINEVVFLTEHFKGMRWPRDREADYSFYETEFGTIVLKSWADTWKSFLGCIASLS
jgi:hypothetical protein